MTAAKTIMLSFNGQYEEGIAGEAGIYPGMALTKTSDGTMDLNTSADGANSPVYVAIEDALQGRTADDVYASGELVRYVQPLPGDRLAIRLKEDEVAVVGSQLIIDQDSGCFIVVPGTTPLPEQVAFEATEALTATGGNKLIAARRI